MASPYAVYFAAQSWLKQDSPDENAGTEEPCYEMTPFAAPHRTSSHKEYQSGSMGPNLFLATAANSIETSGCEQQEEPATHTLGRVSQCDSFRVNHRPPQARTSHIHLSPRDTSLLPSLAQSDQAFVHPQLDSVKETGCPPGEYPAPPLLQKRPSYRNLPPSESPGKPSVEPVGHSALHLPLASDRNIYSTWPGMPPFFIHDRMDCCNLVSIWSISRSSWKGNPVVSLPYVM